MRRDSADEMGETLDERHFSWMHLLPPNLRVEAVKCPPGFAEACERRSATDGLPIGFVWNAVDLPVDLNNLYAVVLRNPTRDSISRLRREGFGHIREFGVVPSFKDPRWLIALDRGATAAAVTHLYAPYRRGARLLFGVARTAARLRLPFRYRDRICIAQRKTPPLESTVREILGVEYLRLAVYCGNSRLSQKVAVLVMDRQARPLAIAKAASTTFGADRLRREAQTLRHLKPSQLRDGSRPSCSSTRTRNLVISQFRLCSMVHGAERNLAPTTSLFLLL